MERTDQRYPVYLEILRRELVPAMAARSLWRWPTACTDCP